MTAKRTKPTTDRGYRVFASKKRRDLRVVESALNGHVWVYAGTGHQAYIAADSMGIQLNVDDARLVIAGLERFVEESAAGTLKHVEVRLRPGEESR